MSHIRVMSLMNLSFLSILYFPSFEAIVFSLKTCTTWKVSLFGVILVPILAHLDLIRRDTPYLSTFSPNAWKYGPEYLRIQTLLTQWYTAKYTLFFSELSGKSVLLSNLARLKPLEAVAQSCSVKKLFLEISQNSQENIWARVSFLIKLQYWGLQLH